MACTDPVDFNENCSDIEEISRLESRGPMHQPSNRDGGTNSMGLVSARLGRSSVLRTHRSLPLSPLANDRPLLPSQHSMDTVSNNGFRSPLVLDDNPSNLLRRYPRFSIATTSMDTGRPNFSADELTSTELSDDENAIINEVPSPGPPSVRSLMKYKFVRDVRAIWSSQAKRLRYARRRIKRRPYGYTDETALHTITAALDASPISLRSTIHDDARSAQMSLFPEQALNTSGAAKLVFSYSDVPAYPTEHDYTHEAHVASGEKNVTFHGQHMYQYIQADSVAPCSRYRTSSRQIDPFKTIEDEASLDWHASSSPPRIRIKTQSMVDVGGLSDNSSGQIASQPECVGHTSARRASLSSIEKKMQSSFRPGTMQQRRSFNSTVPWHAETLFIDTPRSPATAFIFPTRRLGASLHALGHSRPASRAAPSFSTHTVFQGQNNYPSSQMEFGRMSPAGHQRVPAHTMRRIEPKDLGAADGSGIPSLPDSPIMFDKHSHDSGDGSLRIQGKVTVSRASKWSTKVHTRGSELQDREVLTESSANEDTKDYFAIKSCQRIVRALSNRVGSNHSLHRRFRSRRYGNGEKDVAET